MPMTLYTEQEVQHYKNQIGLLRSQVQILEQLRPVWILDSATTAGALSELWKALDAKNQTQAVIRLRELLALRPDF